MLRFLRLKKAQSALEAVTVIVLIIGAMLVFQKYLVRAISGRWQTVGDSWGNGRLYDKNKTTECLYNQWGTTNKWYLASCFRDTCYLQCIGETATAATCDACLDTNCVSDVDGVDVCNQ